MTFKCNLDLDCAWLGHGFCILGHRSQLFLLYSLIVHSSVNLFSQHSRQFILSFSKSLGHEKPVFHSFYMANMLLFSQSFR